MNTIWQPIIADDAGPKYLALSRALREAIREGELPKGAQLPTVRDLAWRLRVTPGTVSRAYQIATQEGLLQATVGRGTFVAARNPRLGPLQALEQDRDPRVVAGRVDLRSPQLPEVGQLAAIGDAMRRIAGSVDMSWLDYTSQAGEAPLRAAICDWLADRVLGGFDPGDIMLTNGGQNAVRLILDCCLRGDRPVVLTDDLAYPGFRYAARLARAEVIGIEMDGEGMLPDALELACRRHAAQILFLTPEAHNPTTTRMSGARRADIVAIARRHDLQIIEDECYAAPEHDFPALRALAPERCWYVGSLSKSLAASLRFGYVVCPTGMGEAGRLTAQHSFFALSRPMSALCLDLFASGAAADIRARVLREMTDRLQLMVNRLGAFDLCWQAGVPFAWLRLPQGWRASTFTRMAETDGVLVRSADQYALVHGRAPNAVRLAVPGHIARAELEAGLATLGQLLPRPPSDMAV